MRLAAPLSSSLTLWLTGSLTQGGSKDGIEIYLTGQSSDTQRLVLKAALTISDQLCLINSTKKDGFMTWNMKYFSRNIRLRIWYIFITTIPKKYVS